MFQRPQHLLSRFSRDRRVIYIEEPIFDSETPRLSVARQEEGALQVVTPHLSNSSPTRDLELLIAELFRRFRIHSYLLWYYTPPALPFTRSLFEAAKGVVYDCMDELANFKDANPALKPLEQELFQRASVVFTGGHRLYQAKKKFHGNIHPFPSSIDVAHFEKARGNAEDPPDQRETPSPRIGFFGVIDERIDFALIEGVAERRPDWQLIMVGPTAKIDPATLPKRANIHYLGCKSYSDLPNYLGGWSVAMLPFARNEATQYISPTKTPEYLAAGRPVVSTSIHDVVHPYHDLGLVLIADEADAFVAAVERCLQGAVATAEWQRRVDRFLSVSSWDDTYRRMNERIEGAIAHSTKEPSRISAGRS